MIDPLAPDFENTPISPARPRTNFSSAALNLQAQIQVVLFATNDEQALSNTIESLRRQSFRAWSLVIVGSSQSDMFSAADMQFEFVREIAATCSEPYRIMLTAGSLLEPCALEKMIWSLVAHPSKDFCVTAYVTIGSKHSLSKMNSDFQTNPFSAPVCISGVLFRATVMLPNNLTVQTITSLECGAKYFLQLCANDRFGIGIAEHLLWHKTESASEKAKYDLTMISKYYSSLPKLVMELSADGNKPPFQNPIAKHNPHMLAFVCPLEIGGSTKFNRDLVEHLANSGWTSTIVVTTPQNQTWLPVFAKSTPDIFLLDRYMEMSEYYRFTSYIIESRQPDVLLITHSTFGYDILPMLKMRYPHIKYIDYTHVHREHFGEGGYATISTSWQHLLDMNIVSSRQLKQYMVEHGADETKIEVAHTNIDTDKVKPDADIRRVVRQDLGIPNDTPVILFAGRFEEQKQPTVLLKTLDKLANDYQSDFIALLAGSGDYREWMLEFVAERSLFQKVWFLGSLTNQETIRVMKASDIFFLPSKWEGISLAFYEAMASGLTIVGSNVGGQAELVTPDCGMLVDVGDEEKEIIQYAKYLSMLLSDPAKRTAMQHNCRLRVESNFPISEMGSRMISCFTKAMNSPQSVVDFALSEHALETYFSLIVMAEIEGIAGQRAINRAQKIGVKFKQAKENAEKLQLQYEGLKNELELFRASARQVGVSTVGQ